jgi:hypothetical protein
VGVTSRDLLIEHLGAPVTDKNVKRLRPIMRELGWNGPQMMRHGKKTQNGYWRPPTVGGAFSPDLEDTDTFTSNDTAAAEVKERTDAQELELENSRLRKAVSDLTLDKLILQEASRGNF